MFQFDEAIKMFVIHTLCRTEIISFNLLILSARISNLLSRKKREQRQRLRGAHLILVIYTSFASPD